MTLYVNSQGAHPDNIEIEGTGGHRAGLRQNVPGVIYFANTGVRSSMFSDEIFDLISAWETECQVHSTMSRASFAWITNAFEAGEIT